MATDSKTSKYILISFLKAGNHVFPAFFFYPAPIVNVYEKIIKNYSLFTK